VEKRKPRLEKKLMKKIKHESNGWYAEKIEHRKIIVFLM
jgi:hypothetical protein